MNRVSKWFVELYQKLRDRYYEGPQPPRRITQIAELFAATHTRATREDWIQFASNHARESYQAGYARGFEWRERVARGEKPEEYEDPDWEWESEVELTELDREVQAAPEQQIISMMGTMEEIHNAERKWRESLIPHVDGSHDRSNGSSRSAKRRSDRRDRR